MTHQAEKQCDDKLLVEQRKRAKRERQAEKRRKKTRDKHRSQGLGHTKKCRPSRRHSRF